MRARIKDIRRIRDRLGLTRAELAVYLGVPETTVERWESGDDATEPQGLIARLLSALATAALVQAPDKTAHIVRSCGTDRQRALECLRRATG